MVTFEYGFDFELSDLLHWKQSPEKISEAVHYGQVSVYEMVAVLLATNSM